MLDPRTKRRWFLLVIVAASAALIAYSGWLLWPVYQEHRAVQRLLQAVRFGDQEAVDAAVAEVKKFRWMGTDAVTELVKLLSSKTGGVRWRATYALGEIGEAVTALDPELMRERAVPALFGALSDEHVRIRAAYALGQIGPDARAAIPELIQALEHEEQYFNGQAGHALARIGEPALEPLLAAAASGAGLRSLRSIDVLGEMGAVASRRIVPALVSAFKQGNPDIQSRAATALTKCGRSAVPDLIQLLRDKQGRGLISKALGEIGPGAKDAIPTLLDAITESGPYGDTTAAQALGKIGGVSALIKALDLEAARFSVIQALVGSGPAAREAIPTLLQILKTDERPHVRNAVTWVFRNLGPDASDAVPALVKLIEEQPAGGNDIRYEAVGSLERIGPAAAGAVPALVKLIERDAHERLQSEAAIALSEIDPDHPMVVQAMMEILKQQDDWYRKHRAIQALGKTGPKAALAVPLLIEELKKGPKSQTRQAAVEALGNIGPDAAEAVPTLIQVLAEEDSPQSWTRIVTIRALGSIGPAAKAALPSLTELKKLPNATVQQAAERAVRLIEPEQQN